MKFRFSSGITLAFGKYEPALKLRFLSRLINLSQLAPY
jgi:hypothetical protein